MLPPPPPPKFLIIGLPILEHAIHTRLALNSEIHLLLPLGSWIIGAPPCRHRPASCFNVSSTIHSLLQRDCVPLTMRQNKFLLPYIASVKHLVTAMRKVATTSDIYFLLCGAMQLISDPCLKLGLFRVCACVVLLCALHRMAHILLAP